MTDKRYWTDESIAKRKAKATEWMLKVLAAAPSLTPDECTELANGFGQMFNSKLMEAYLEGTTVAPEWPAGFGE